MDLLATTGGSSRKPLLVVHVDHDTLLGKDQSEGKSPIGKASPMGADCLEDEDSLVGKNPWRSGWEQRLHETRTAILSPEAIERLACDAMFRRVVFGPESELLDVGRLHRLVTQVVAKPWEDRGG